MAYNFQVVGENRSICTITISSLKVIDIIYRDYEDTYFRIILRTSLNNAYLRMPKVDTKSTFSQKITGGTSKVL